jgi:hypothetical protein
MMKGMGEMGMMNGKGAGFADLPAGNGQPVVGGSVTAVSGTSVTITNSAGVTYTVDASAAKFSKPGATAATIAIWPSATKSSSRARSTAPQSPHRLS